MLASIYQFSDGDRIELELWISSTYRVLWFEDGKIPFTRRSLNGCGMPDARGRQPLNKSRKLPGLLVRLWFVT